MDNFKPFQSLVTLAVADAPTPPPPGGYVGEIIQSRNGYLDLADSSSVTLHVEVLHAGTNGKLYLETAVTEEGPWLTIKDWTAKDDVTLQLTTYYSAQNKLARFVRWRFVGTSAVEVTFRMRYLLAEAV